MARDLRVSIVTPSRNAGRFVERTIKSVLAQDYLRIGYRVQDGNSSDGTIDTLKRYQDHLVWDSREDGSAVRAINLGFQATDGDIFGWLSADDTYAPGAISAAVKVFEGMPEVDVVYGLGEWIDSNDKPLGSYPTVAFDPQRFERECFICQPACFIRRRAIAEGEPLLRERWQSVFDYDLWIRLAKSGARFYHLPKLLAHSRLHADTKTLGKRDEALSECALLQAHHFGKVSFQAAYTYSAHRLHGTGPEFQVPPRSIRAFLFSLAVGLKWSPQHRGAYLRDWWSAIRLSAFRRLWNDGSPAQAVRPRL